MKKKIIATIIVAMISNIIIIYQFYLWSYGIDITNNIKNVSFRGTNIEITDIKLFAIIVIFIIILFITRFLIKLCKENKNKEGTIRKIK